MRSGRAHYTHRWKSWRHDIHFYTMSMFTILNNKHWRHGWRLVTGEPGELPRLQTFIIDHSCYPTNTRLIFIAVLVNNERKYMLHNNKWYSILCNDKDRFHAKYRFLSVRVLGLRSIFTFRFLWNFMLSTYFSWSYVSRFILPSWIFQLSDLRLSVLIASAYGFNPSISIKF